ncbi:hypothetical protein QJQ45_019432 [Haematococcus lacustris]|nr:hypothetical protein QJQ45_019432 [Haematococcus lacustris]
MTESNRKRSARVPPSASLAALRLDKFALNLASSSPGSAISNRVAAQALDCTPLGSAAQAELQSIRLAPTPSPLPLAPPAPTSTSSPSSAPGASSQAAEGSAAALCHMDSQSLSSHLPGCGAGLALAALPLALPLVGSAAGSDLVRLLRLAGGGVLGPGSEAAGCVAAWTLRGACSDSDSDSESDCGSGSEPQSDSESESMSNSMLAGWAGARGGSKLIDCHHTTVTSSLVRLLGLALPTSKLSLTAVVGVQGNGCVLLLPAPSPLPAPPGPASAPTSSHPPSPPSPGPQPPMASYPLPAPYPAVEAGRGGLAVALLLQLSLWDVRAGEQGGLVQRLPVAPGGCPVYSLAWVPPHPLPAPQLGGAGPEAARGPGGGLLALAGADRSVVMLEPRKWRVVHKWAGAAKYTIHYLAVSQAARGWCYVAGLDTECVVGRWDHNTGPLTAGNANSSSGGHGRAVGSKGMQAAAAAEPGVGAEEQGVKPGAGAGVRCTEGAGMLSFRGDSKWFGIALAHSTPTLGSEQAEGAVETLVALTQSGQLNLLQVEGKVRGA